VSKRFLALTLLLLLGPSARAHDGPPFPIVLDEIAGPYKVSIWTDPDVGVGTFFVYVERQDGESTEEVRVRLIVRPTSGRLDEAAYPCERQVVGRQVRYFGEVEFDAQEFWQVRVEIDGSPGKAEILSEVEATPPGLGRFDLLFYLFPFVLLGGLWAYGVIRSRHRRPQVGDKEGACSAERS
jgi:hypothetical protein